MIKLSQSSTRTSDGPAGATDSSPSGEADPLRAVLLESITRNKGLAVYTRGASIGIVVKVIDGNYVIGRSQQATCIVIRLDQIDAVSAVF
jgi:hypothetical protein